MERSEGSRSRFRRILLRAGIVTILLVLGSAFLTWWYAQPPNYFGSPLAVAEFHDGAEVRIYEAVCGDNLNLEYSDPLWFLHRNKPLSSEQMWIGGVTYWIDGPGDRIRHAIQEGQREKLMLVAWGKGPDGSPLVPNVASAMWNTRNESHVELEYAGNRLSEGNVASKGRDGYWVEVEDGEGGWLALQGPIVPSRGDGRGFCVIDFFPRRNPELKLRVGRPGGDFAECRIPNPGHGITPLDWTPEEVATRKRFGEGELAIRDFRATGPRLPIVNPITPSPNFVLHPFGDQPRGAFNLSGILVEVDNGNHGAVIPWFPESRLFRYSGWIQRTSEYRWPAGKVLLVAEGVVDAEGKLRFEINKEGRKLQLASVSQRPRGSDSWTLELKGEGSGTVPGVCEDLRVALFVDDENFSRPGTFQSSRSAASGPRMRYGATFKVSEIPLETGTEIRVGILPPATREPFEFTIPVEEIRERLKE